MKNDAVSATVTTDDFDDGDDKAELFCEVVEQQMNRNKRISQQRKLPWGLTTTNSNKEWGENKADLLNEGCSDESYIQIKLVPSLRSDFFVAAYLQRQAIYLAKIKQIKEN